TCADEQNPTADTCPIITPDLYTVNAPVTSGGYTVTTYSPPADLVTAGRGGRIRTNRDGYYTNFKGLEFTATKRLANKWMSRVALSFNDWTEHWEDGVTPTSSGIPAGNAGGNPTRAETDPLVQGGQVAILSGGSGKASFYSSVKWQLYANALVQLPWDFELSGALFGRQGGSFPVSIRTAIPRDGTVPVLALEEVDTQRYDNVWNFDTRLAKNFKIGRTGVTVSGEAFNLFNNNVVLSRARYVGSTLNRIEEILAPRTFRIGARLSF
ncbi:MAG TPA: hypothetical protein VFM29_01090, partial [Vicinamibacteria bacterium]|nr:hypothetical protein [Vicinamibacteria bacterium]